MIRSLLFLFAFSIPFTDASRFYLGAGSLPEIVIVLLAVLTVTRWFVRPIHVTPGHLVLLTLLVGVSSVSWLTNYLMGSLADAGAGLEALVRSTEFLIVFFVISQLTSEPSYRRWLMVGVLAGGALEAFVVLFHWYTGPGNALFHQWGPAWAQWYTVENFRVWGTFGNPLPLTTYLTVIVGILTVIALLLPRTGRRLVVQALLLISLLALVATGSRTGLVVLLIPALYVVRHLSIGRLLSILVLAPFLGAMVLMSGVGRVLLSRVEQLGSTDNSLLQRLDVYASSLRMMADRPLTGVGPGNFAPAYEASYRNVGSSADPSSFTPENLFLIYGSERGIVAGALLIGAFAFILVPVWLRLRRDHGTRTTSAILTEAALVGLLCFMASSLIQASTDAPSHLLMMTLLGVVDSYVPYVQRQKQESYQRKMRPYGRRRVATARKIPVALGPYSSGYGLRP
jgi:hypothetical protein